MSKKMKLPSQYNFLLHEQGPKHMVLAIELYGVLEGEGVNNNPAIMGWAQYLNPQVAHFYDADSKPWCAVFAGYALKTAGHMIPPSYDAMRALKYASVGDPVPAGQAKFGDILIKERVGGGHVCFCVGEDDTHYHCLGGNQRDMVCIVRYPKGDFKIIRRPKYSENDKRFVKTVKLRPEGLPAGSED